MKKAALVTGSARRLGKEIALRLGNLGYYVYVHYRNSQKPAELVLKKIKKAGGDGALVQADVSQRDDVKALALTLKKKGLPVHILVNNVGEYITGPLLTFSQENFASLIQTNLLGSYYIIQNCLPLFHKKGGSIINIGYAGLDSLRAAPHNTAYTISKSGLLTLTKSYAASLAGKNIRVNMISPGHLTNSVDLPQNIKKHIPLGRAGRPKEICDMLEYLVSSKGSYITGQNIEIAGGYTPGG